jgi:hypothetical protein
MCCKHGLPCVVSIVGGLVEGITVEGLTDCLIIEFLAGRTHPGRMRWSNNILVYLAGSSCF